MEGYLAQSWHGGEELDMSVFFDFPFWYLFGEEVGDMSGGGCTRVGGG